MNAKTSSCFFRCDRYEEPIREPDPSPRCIPGSNQGSRKVSTPASPIRSHAAHVPPLGGGLPHAEPQVKRPCSRVWLMNNLPEAFTRSRIRWLTSSPPRWRKQTRLNLAARPVHAGRPESNRPVPGPGPRAPVPAAEFPQPRTSARRTTTSRRGTPAQGNLPIPIIDHRARLCRLVFRYSGMILNARISGPRSATKKQRNRSS